MAGSYGIGVGSTDAGGCSTGAYWTWWATVRDPGASTFRAIAAFWTWATFMAAAGVVVGAAGSAESCAPRVSGSGTQPFGIRLAAGAALQNRMKQALA